MEKLYYNGPILTMEGEQLDRQHPAQALLERDGRIAFVGSLEEAKALAPKAKCIDLRGRCLMPAFLDAHSHFVMNGQMSICADLSQCSSYEEIITTLRDYLARHKLKPGQLLLGFGYDHNFLQEGGQPDKRVLDQVSKDHPIMILHVSGHLCCVNSKLLELCGLDASTPDPQGGSFGRLPGSRELSGYAEETAMQPLQMQLQKLMKPDILGMLRGMQKAYLENGVTTVQDGASGKTEMKLLQLMGRLGLLKVDVVAYPVMGEVGSSLMRQYGEKYKDYHRHLKIGGYKLILDGSPQGRTAWMTEPYLGGEEDYCAYPWMKTEEVQTLVRQAVSEGKQLLVHCNGDAAGDQYLNAYQKAVEETGCRRELRPVMIHCQTARDDQLARMKQLGMIASIFVGHVWFWGDIHVQNFGPQRGNRISPVRSAMEAGLVVNFHQDTPVTKPNMLHSVWCAVNRLSRQGQTLGPEQAIGVYDALKAVTINTAYQYFEEDSKGSLRAGKRADLVILDRSPLEVEPMELRNIQVLETIKDGKTLYKKA